MDSIKAGGRKIGMGRWCCVFPLVRFFLARRGREFIAAALLFACCAASADTFQINSVAGSDGRVTDAGATVPNFMFVGNAFGDIPVAGVTMFQLPPLPPGHKVVDANLTMMMYWEFATSFTFGLDLYGLRADPSPAMAGSDFYQGPYVEAAGRTPISPEFVPAGGIAGLYDLAGQAAAQSNLAAWVQAQYDAGATNQYIFFCIAADQVAPEAQTYRFRAGNDANNPPLLTLVTEDLSTGPCELVYPDSAPELPAQKPGVTTNLPFLVLNEGYDATNVTVQLESNYPWLTVHSGSNTLAQILRGETATNRFDVTLATNAPPGLFADAFALSMQGTGTDGSTSNFSANVELEVLNTAFASIDKTSLFGDVNDTDVAQLTISNTGDWALSYELSNSEAWLQVPSGPLSLPAGAVTSITVTADASLTPGQGRYTDTLLVTYNNNSSQPNPAVFDLVFDVGPKIEPLAGEALIVEAGGVNQLAGVYEPGERLHITVVSTNNGAIAVSNIVHTLSADNRYFTVSAISNAADYALMTVGSSTSTTYAVDIAPDTPEAAYSFTAVNSAAGSFWENSFSLEVFNRAVPVLSTNSLFLQPGPGFAEEQQVVVSNAGNAALDFEISDDAVWDSVLSANTAATPSERLSGGTALPLVGPSPQQASYAGESDTIDIGFAFPFFGSTYTNLYIDSNGAVLLTNSSRINNTSWADNTTGDLPLGSRPLIAPFRHVQLEISDSDPVRFVRAQNPERLVLVYDQVTLSSYPQDGTDLQFQVELFPGGRIKFSYYQINGSSLETVAVGVQGDDEQFQNFDIVPSSGTAVDVTSVENPWISISPRSGTVPAFGSAAVAFAADAQAQDVGTTADLTATFSWSTGSSDAVAVTAEVAEAVPLLVAPSNVVFHGPVGEITSSSMVLSNAGTGELRFTITDTDSAAASYSGTVVNAADWTDISATGTSLQMLDPHENPYINATNEGYSALQPIGFEFPFYDGVYTQFSVGVNGGISLGSAARIRAGGDFSSVSDGSAAQLIAPYRGNLFLDGNASIRYHSTADELVVTWQNMEQQGLVPGTNLTFQAVLSPDGRIEFRYRQVNGSTWPFTKWGTRSGSQSASGVLTLPADAVVTTNEYGYTKTNYPNALVSRKLSIAASDRPVITYTPTEGSIPPSGSVSVVLRGDAFGLAAGSTNTALLSIEYEADTNQVEVVFVTDGSAPDPVAAALDEDGDGMSYDAEMIAGTDPLDAGSVLVLSTDAGRTLSWPTVPGRRYTVFYSLDLTGDFLPLEGATGLETNQFVDTVHAEEPVIFYKVTVD